MNKLTKEQNEVVLGALQAGAIAMVGEWRGAKAEEIKWSAKEGRAAGSMAFETHSVEVGEGAGFQALSIRVRISDGVDPARVSFARFQRGGAVLVRVRSFMVSKGQVSAEAEEVLPL